jgi:hypothetical protein
MVMPKRVSGDKKRERGWQRERLTSRHRRAEIPEPVAKLLRLVISLDLAPIDVD